MNKTLQGSHSELVHDGWVLTDMYFGLGESSLYRSRKVGDKTIIQILTASHAGGLSPNIDSAGYILEPVPDVAIINSYGKVGENAHRSKYVSNLKDLYGEYWAWKEIKSPEQLYIYALDCLWSMKPDRIGLIPLAAWSIVLKKE